MPTNRRRQARNSKRQVQVDITPEYIEELTCRLYVDEQLTEAEIVIAKKLGLYSETPGLSQPEIVIDED